MPFCYLYKYYKRKDKRIINIKNYTTPRNNQKAYLSASATVEAALVIPIFVYVVLAVMFMVQILLVKSSVMQALYLTTRKIDSYAYEYQSVKKAVETEHDTANSSDTASVINDSALKAFAYTTLLSNLNQDFSKQSNILGGNIGISMLDSRILEHSNEVYLKVSYCIRNPFDLFGLAVVPIEQSFTGLAWLGEDYRTTDTDSNGDSIVYITENGTVYHKDRNCTYLAFHIKSVLSNTIEMQRNLQGAKYYPCEKCGQNIKGINVYITDYGDRYHTSINCSKLSRNVLTIPLSQVGDRKPCSKCGGKAND